MPDGGGMLNTSFILSGFASIPRLLTMKPRNFSADTPKAHLDGFSFMLYSLRLERLEQMSYVELGSGGFYQHVIYVHLHGRSYLLLEHPVH